MMRFDILGKEIARIEDALVLPEPHLEAVRGRLGSLASSPRKRVLKKGRLALVAVGALAAAAALVLYLLAPFRALEARVMGRTDALQTGVWLDTPDGEPLPLVFSDGSSVVLEPGARAMLVRLSSLGAELRFDRGRANFSIVHRRQTRWSVSAGPFAVRVIGTVFDLSWDPAREELRVSLEDGRVAVQGPLVGESQAVEQGQELKVSLADSNFAVRKLDPARSEKSPADANADREPVKRDQAANQAQGGSSADVTPASPRPRAFTRPSRPENEATSGRGAGDAVRESGTSERWIEFARANRFDEAFAEVAQRGFAEKAAQASASELELLGDVARLSGRPELAREAFAAARARFGGTPEARRAAFFLGRLCQDQLGELSEALRWYRAYLGEEPEGSFSGEALGRIVEVSYRTSGAASAKADAASYLRRFPNGPHAAIAQRVMRESASDKND